MPRDDKLIEKLSENLQKVESLFDNFKKGNILSQEDLGTLTELNEQYCVNYSTLELFADGSFSVLRGCRAKPERTGNFKEPYENPKVAFPKPESDIEHLIQLVSKNKQEDIRFYMVGSDAFAFEISNTDLVKMFEHMKQLPELIEINKARSEKVPAMQRDLEELPQAIIAEITKATYSLSLADKHHPDNRNKVPSQIER